MMKLPVKIDGKYLYANPNTLRIRLGSKGPATTIDAFLYPLEKAQRRMIRKTLYRAGYRRMAGAGIHH